MPRSARERALEAYSRARASGAAFRLLEGGGLRILGLAELPAQLRRELLSLLATHPEELLDAVLLEQLLPLPRGQRLLGIPLAAPEHRGAFIRAAVREELHHEPEETLRLLARTAAEFAVSPQEGSPCWLELRTSRGKLSLLVHVLDCKPLRLSLAKLLSRAALRAQRASSP